MIYLQVHDKFAGSQVHFPVHFPFLQSFPISPVHLGVRRRSVRVHFSVARWCARSTMLTEVVDLPILEFCISNYEHQFSLLELNDRLM